MESIGLELPSKSKEPLIAKDALDNRKKTNRLYNFEQNPHLFGDVPDGKKFITHTGA